MTIALPSDAFAFLFGKRDAWWFMDRHENILEAFDDEQVAIESITDFGRDLDRILRFDSEGTWKNVTQDIADDLFDTWLKDAEEGDEPCEFVQRRIKGWRQTFDARLEDCREEERYRRSVASIEGSRI